MKGSQEPGDPPGLKKKGGDELWGSVNGMWMAGGAEMEQVRPVMEYDMARTGMCPAHGSWMLNSPRMMPGLGVEKKTVSQMSNSSLSG